MANRRGMVDYNQNNFCRKCYTQYPKNTRYCSECKTQLATKPKAKHRYNKRNEPKRID